MTPNRGTAVIVGASLSGLMTGLALSRAGWDVTLLERVGSFPRTGAAIGLDDGLLGRLARLAGRPAFPLGPPPVAQQGATWSELHARLRAAAEAAPRLALHHDVPLRGVV
ncbi:FAD-dependent oxidoreductase [Stigmatella erecta]|uniref:FAD binding domain-containing protein n=1 Tax=Stigmatella erecta TaxID=83460 RepID=A0A1I0CPR6_9BACT|nr:FAD-dependent monooxygenase [Stigmatella erecta]SET21685.1 FAD binding domain-containing protein [Stigmatella erecta]